MSSSSSSASSAKGSSRRRIYITGYSSKEDPHDIKKLFKKYGKIEEFSWKGKFCFIQYEEADDAIKAAKKMHKEEFNDYTLIVEVARSQKRSDGACYACGKKGHLQYIIILQLIFLYSDIEHHTILITKFYKKIAPETAATERALVPGINNQIMKSREKKKSKHKKHKKKKSSTSSSSSKSSSSEKKKKKKKAKSKAKSKSKKRRDSSSKSRSRSREKSEKSKSSSKSSDSGKKSKEKDKVKIDDKSNNGNAMEDEKSTKGKGK